MTAAARTPRPMTSPDDEGGAAAAEVDDVVPVAADLRALGARAVERGDRELLGDHVVLGQQRALQLVGDAVLAAGGLGGRRRRGAGRLGGQLVGDVLVAAAQPDRPALGVVLDLADGPVGADGAVAVDEADQVVDRARRARPRARSAASTPGRSSGWTRSAKAASKPALGDLLVGEVGLPDELLPRR